MKTLGPKLPIDDFLPQIQQILTSHSALVLTASPGAGKTTRVPPLCQRLFKGQVLVLEPRRIAAMAAASRIAEENEWTLGQEVGWQVRFDHQTSESTRLIFMTEALLARRMIHDPELEGVDAIILDEFHERSLTTDLTYGLLKELRDLGRDIKLIVMSATLSAEQISKDLGGAPILQVPGQLFPLEVHYQKAPQRLITDATFYETLVKTIKEATAKTKSNVLVFLPGLGEIERTRERLRDWSEQHHIDVVPLHGSLPLDEQRRALQRGQTQRVILSTNIAESSVTIDGINTVVDSGLVRIHRYDVRTGFSRLDLARISQGSAIQRAGRSARQEPGHCYRLWNKQDELSMPKDEVPEIQRADLSEALLFLAHQGVTDFKAFPWLEAPPTHHLLEAEKTLMALKAIGTDRRMTEKGRQLLRFPMPPRLGALLLAAQEISQKGAPEVLEVAARLAAILQERDFIKGDISKNHLGDHLECDLLLRLHLFEKLAPQPLSKSAGQIRRLLPKASGPGNSSQPLEVLLRRLLLRAFPDRLCRRRQKTDRGVMAGGRGVKLSADSLVKESEFFIAVQGMDGVADTETTVALACGMSKDFLLKELGPQLERRRELIVDDVKGQVFIREGKFFGEFAIDEPSYLPPTPEQIAERLPELCVLRLPEILKKNEGLQRWFERFEFMRSRDAEIPALAKSDLKEIFTLASSGQKSIEAVAEQDLVYFFMSILPKTQQALMKQGLPEKIQVPSGSWIPVHYPTDKDPYMEVRLQEVFGWRETPKVMEGQIPVTIHLLAPNFRPVQVTSNLSSFWQNGYPEVRKELRSQYPKHSWPDDPLTARAEAKGRPRN